MILLHLKIFKLFGFPIIRLWAPYLSQVIPYMSQVIPYLSQVIPETRLVC